MAAATYVYVISGDHGRQKIGSSDNPPRRIRELQTGSPYKLRFEFIGKTEDRAGGAIEVEAQFMLNAHKAPGGDEWFTVPPDVALTAVMAAARRLGYRCTPVDVDKIKTATFDLAGGSNKVATAIAAVPFVGLMGWLLYSFDHDRVGGIATIVCALVLMGLFKLLRKVLIDLGAGLVRFDDAMHAGEKVKLPD